ncbi:MAG: crossover junction endodeoxyribonuclease RuvC [bacterium]|jgi:crossover junction endodeoxyribonuclease RuvC
MTSSDPAKLESVPADCPWEIILGIDPGTRVCGYGAIVEAADGPRLLAAGVLRPTGGRDVPLRLASLRRETDRLLERLRPKVVVVESAFAAVNVQSALRIGEARGVILAAAALTGARVEQYAPAVAKKTLIGNGNASKEQTAAIVANMLGLAEPPEPLDVTDALSLALAFAQRSRTADLLARSTSKSRLQP